MVAVNHADPEPSAPSSALPSLPPAAAPTGALDAAFAPSAPAGDGVEWLRLRLKGGMTLAAVSLGAAEVSDHDDPTAAPVRWVMSLGLPDGHGALFALVEGVPATLAAAFQRSFQEALFQDRGTPASRLQRSVRAACRHLDQIVLHRHELTGFGVTALLVEARQTAYAYFCQLPPCQAYVLEADGVRTVPAEQLQRADQVASPDGRSWEVELEVSRVALRPGSCSPRARCSPSWRAR